MAQDTPKNPDNNKKKFVKKVIIKKPSNQSAKNSELSDGKKVVKRIIKKTVKQNSQMENDTVSRKINYKEEIEKLAPTTPRKEENSESKKIINSNPSKVLNENTVIKSATSEQINKTSGDTIIVGKKVLHKKSRLKRIFQKYGVLLTLFFVTSLSYLGWMHVVPAVINFKITSTDINNFLQPKIGFKVDSSNAHFYTTPQLAMGIRFKNFKLVYPEGRIDDDKMLFLKARVAIFEVPLIPLLLRTIKFNEFSLRSVNANLYQDKHGEYAYLKQFKSGFNPNAKKYLLEVPDITVLSYNMPSYNEKTGTFTKKRGTRMKIPAQAIKKVLKDAPNANTIMIR